MSVHRLAERKKDSHAHRLPGDEEPGEKIAMLTAYDCSVARIIDDAGIGVSWWVICSTSWRVNTTTLPITLDRMIYHAPGVVRAVKRSRWWWLDYRLEPTGKIQPGRRCVRIRRRKSGACSKMEATVRLKNRSTRTCRDSCDGPSGITPIPIYKFGTYTVRAKGRRRRKNSGRCARLLQQCGCFCHRTAENSG